MNIAALHLLHGRSRLVPLVLSPFLPLLLILGACASAPSNIRVGMSRAEVLERFGTPAVDRPDRTGERLVFSSAPQGQFAYAVDLGADATVIDVEQVLTLEHFAEIKVGSWTQNDVLWHFGIPAIRHELNHQLVWDYRFRESDAFNGLFSITFNEAGIVSATQNGPDWSMDNGGPNGHHR